jgi:putative methyltransferase (TIGR04325 family)
MKFLKSISPPISVRLYKKYLAGYGWFGDYKSWEEASKAATGYDSKNILEKVKKALLRVKNGEKVGERDSVLLEKIQYSPVILAGLFLTGKKNPLSILDFGGSLGTTYFQNKKFLDLIPNLRYSIVEQENFTKEGKKYFEDDYLKFYKTVDDCLKKEEPNLLILSSVIQYLKDPYKFLEYILSKKFETIVIDRTPFIQKRDRITLQKVDPRIYKASYPCWFFNEKKFKELFKEYELIEEFNALDTANIKSQFKGFLYKRK